MRCLDGDKYVDEKRENENFLVRMQEEFLRVPRGRRSHYRGEIQIRAFWDNIRLLIQTDEEDGEEDNEEDYGEVNERVKKMVNEKLNENIHEGVKGSESKSKLPFKDSTDEKVKSRPLRLVSEVGMDAVRLDLINGMEQDRLDGVSVSLVQILALAPLRPLNPGNFSFKRPRQVPTSSTEFNTMDPFSAEGELLNLHNYFLQGQYQEAIDFDTSALSPENALPARVISLRAQIALGQSEDVLADIQGEDDVELKVVEALAILANGDEDKAVEIVTKLAEDSSDNAVVQVLGGTVLQAAGKSDEALQLLALHQGNLEAVALIVQIHLEQNRTDLAIKEVQQARRWAQDSLLVNLAESWVGLRVGGEKYQQAFYVFEELAQAPSTSSTQSLVAQAIAEIHLGRLEEAEAALEQAFSKDPENAEVLANKVVLNTISGKDSSDLLSSLGNTSPEHAFLKDLEEKSSLFDKAATKYSAKVT
ncbi:hypothetical protein EYC80_011049 [Monilinia laxa]|uniref:Coatomer subunit epsilon n=1 Tax=Monilinia laxa TaxID=61186 RepID=A0A5N6JQG8_MONLA|nr:hypothetical protein EYC80_011049 [Monilinia laxa]